MERYLCSVNLTAIRNYSIYNASLMTTDDDVPHFIFQFKDLVTSWFQELYSFPNRAEIVELLCLPNHPITMKVLCEKPGRMPGILRLYLLSTFFDSASLTVSRNELEFQHVFQQFLDAFGSRIFMEPLQTFGVSGLMKPKSLLKYSLLPERHVAKEQLESAQKILEVMTRAPLKHTVTQGIPLNEQLHFYEGQITDSPPTAQIDNNFALIMYTKGFGRRRVLSLVCDAVMSGAIDAGTQRRFPYFYEYKLFNASNAVLILCKDEHISSWENELDNCFVIKEDCDFDLITFDVIAQGITIVLSESALSHLSERDTFTYDVVRELFSKDAVHKRPLLDKKKCQRFYVGNVGQRHDHAIVPLTFVHYRCIIVDQGLEDVLDEYAFTSEFTLYNVGYPSLLPVYALRLPIPQYPMLHRLVNDPNSGMVIKLNIPQHIIRKLSFVPVSVQVSAPEKLFLNRIQKIATTRSMINRHLDVSTLLLGGEYNDIAGCAFNLALPRLCVLSKQTAETNIKKHFSLLNGTLGQRLLSDFGVLDEEFASRSYVQKNFQSDQECAVCFSSPGAILTLCGHSLCSECKNMLGEEQLVIKCPVCRSSLTHYDFVEVGSVDTHFEFVDIVDILPTKISQILQALSNLFLKRRNKKRSLSRKALIIAPQKALQCLKEQLEPDYKVILEWDVYDSEDPSPRVFLSSVENLNDEQIDDTLEGIILAAPTQTNVYFDLIKLCKNRTAPLPLQIFYASGIEDITETIECLVNLKN